MCDVNGAIGGGLRRASSYPPLIFTVFEFTSCTTVQALFSQVILISSHLLISYAWHLQSLLQTFLEETTPLLDIILKVYYFTPILGFYFLLAHRTGNTRMFLVFFPDWERRPKAKDSRMLNQGLSQEELFQVTSAEKHSRGELWSFTLKATCGHDDQLETHGGKK